LLVGANVDYPGPYVQRIAGDTSLAPAWPAAGLRLISSGANVFMAAGAQTPRLVRSDATHFIAVWVDVPIFNGGERVMCQRFSLSGTLDPAWPPNGLELDSLFSDYHHNLTCVEDGAGGVTVGWSETRRYRARHVRADGTMPGLYASGPLALFSGPTMGGINFSQGALARGKNDGCCVFWEDQVTGIRGRWFDGDGNVLGCGAPGDTCSALILAGSQYWNVPAAMADGNAGAYVLYSGYVGLYLADHYVTHAHYLGDATASVPPVGAKSSLALAVSPNPAHGALLARFTLPDARPARVELLDLAGRRVLAREVTGAGDRVESLAQSDALAPGVYLVCLTHAGQRRTARAVMVR
jgi:hypothetical protein